MISKNTLINALRCSAMSYADKTENCLECPYRLLEEIKEDFPIPHDILIDGKKYYESCDVDRIVLDAADMLEKLKGEVESDK